MSAVRLLRWTDGRSSASGRGVAAASIGSIDGSVLHEPSDIEKAEALYRQRNLKDSCFSEGAIFQDPAWDLVLELFIAHLKGQLISVTGACEGAGLPSSTGLRWLRVLESRRMVETSRDFNDRRRRLVRLMPDTIASMRAFLSAV